MLSTPVLWHILLEFLAIVVGLYISITAATVLKCLPGAADSLRLSYFRTFGNYCALMGGIHCVASVTTLATDWRFAGPVTWFISQLGFAGLIGLVWHKPARLKKSAGAMVGAAVGIAIAVTFMSGPYYFPDQLIGRPAELIVVVAVLPVLWRLWLKPRTHFQNRLLITGFIFVAQEITMAFSVQFHDAMYFTAYGLRVGAMMACYNALLAFNPTLGNE